MKQPPMRGIMELQRAHDLLLPIVTGEVPSPFPEPGDRQCLQAALEVLCWALRHDHINGFPENLVRIEAALAAAGFKLGKPNAQN